MTFFSISLVGEHQGRHLFSFSFPPLRGGEDLGGGVKKALHKIGVLSVILN